jgi:hypothetical protein
MIRYIRRLIKRHKRWKARRHEQAKAEQHRKGYDYAAGALLRGDRTPIQLQYEYDTSTTFNESETAKAFDNGMLQAVDKLCALGFVEDDRVPYFLG